MNIQSYKSVDKQYIQEFFTAAFTQSDNQSEGKLIGQLSYDLINTTKEKDLFGFVALEDHIIIGCILFSRLKFVGPTEAFILSPVAVATHYQRTGIGKSLITQGLNQLKDKGIELVMTYGDPKYYSQVGFQQVHESIIKPPYKLSQPEGWLGQSLVGDQISAIDNVPVCVEALSKPVYW